MVVQQSKIVAIATLVVELDDDFSEEVPIFYDGEMKRRMAMRIFENIALHFSR